jgi:selenocysteine lyase/cysteine desulfurase
MPGHKGLLGPQGTGVLLCGSEQVRTLIEGGTGSESESDEMPSFLPDRLEAGTHNVPGIAGLLAGADWIRERGVESIREHETALKCRLTGLLRGNGNITVFETEKDIQTGVVSLRLCGIDCETAAERLGERGIAVRAGLHCAPLAHRTAGTLETGTIRISMSPFSTERDVAWAAEEILRLVS